MANNRTTATINMNIILGQSVGGGICTTVVQGNATLGGLSFSIKSGVSLICCQLLGVGLTFNGSVDLATFHTALLTNNLLAPQDILTIVEAYMSGYNAASYVINTHAQSIGPAMFINDTKMALSGNMFRNMQFAPDPWKTDYCNVSVPQGQITLSGVTVDFLYTPSQLNVTGL